jgi:hypothetical protein
MHLALSEDHTINAVTTFRAGDIVLPMAQPFRSFLKEIMEKQDYPVRHTSIGGEVIRPYDITSWSLPMHSGPEVPGNKRIRDISLEKKADSHSMANSALQKKNTAFPSGFPIFTSNGSYKAAFTALQN